MKNLLVLVLLMSISVLKAQQIIALSNHEGILVSYKLTKIDSADDKKDKYLVLVTAENKNDYDLFYTVQPTSGNIIINNDNNNVNFANIKVTNTKGFLSANSVNLQGQLCRLSTLNGWMIYILPKNGAVSQSLTFNVMKGEIPILSDNFFKKLNIISELY